MFTIPSVSCYCRINPLVLTQLPEVLNYLYVFCNASRMFTSFIIDYSLVHLKKFISLPHCRYSCHCFFNLIISDTIISPSTLPFKFISLVELSESLFIQKSSIPSGVILDILPCFTLILNIYSLLFQNPSFRS